MGESVEKQLKEVSEMLSRLNHEDIAKLKGQEYSEAMEVLYYMEDLISDFKLKTNKIKDEKTKKSKNKIKMA